MNDEPENPEAPEDDLLTLLIRQQYRDHHLLLALIEILADKNVLKGGDEAVKSLLAVWAKQLEKETKLEADFQAYVRWLREEWHKPPGGGGKPQ